MGAGSAAAGRPLRAAFLRGALITLAGAGLWGVSGACSQFVLSQGMPPTFVTAVRALVAGALFLALLLVKRRDTLARIFADRRAVAQVCVFGVGLFGSQITFAISIDYTNAGTATVLQMLGSVFIMLYVCLRGRTLPRVGEAAGLACALAATFLIATQGNPGVLVLPAAGLFWGVMNGLAVALYVVCPKEFGLFRRFGSLTVTGLGMCVAGVLAALVWLAQAALAGSVQSAGEMAVVAHGLPAQKASLLDAVEPLSATVLSALWLGTAFSWADWAGFALMVAMVVLVTVGGAKPAGSAHGARKED